MRVLENKHANSHFWCLHQLHWDFRIFLNHIFMLATSNHCVKSLNIPSYSGLHFTGFGLNMEGYGVSLCIKYKYGKIPT